MGLDARSKKLFSLLLLVLQWVGQGCVSENFFSDLSIQTQISDSHISPVDQPGNNPPSGPVVCGGFGGGTGTGNSQNGLLASLTYIPSNSSTINQLGSKLGVGDFANGMPDVVVEPNSIFLSQLNMTTRDFSLGFYTNQGATLKDNSGNTLIQYFSLHIDSELMVNSTDPEGDYQFAVLSDDGTVFSLAPHDNLFQTWIDNDGVHANQLGCSTQPLHLAYNVKIPIHLDYFQGPPTRLGLVLLWRKIDLSDPSSLNDPECGGGEGNTYYFAPQGNDPSVPQSGFLNLLSRGWSVVPSVNFYLPNGTVNPCSK